MADSYAHIAIHYVCSTKLRKPLIPEEKQRRLWKYIIGIAESKHMMPHAVGGMPDHLHVLVCLPNTLPVSKGIQLIKGPSSKWINETWDLESQFAWQGGYGAFSVSRSRMGQVQAYIKNQREHHQRMSFKEEYLKLLKLHEIDYNPDYVLG